MLCVLLAEIVAWLSENRSERDDASSKSVVIRGFDAGSSVKLDTPKPLIMMHTINRVSGWDFSMEV